jgi:hypothetical protein
MYPYILILQGLPTDVEAEAPLASNASQPHPHVTEHPSPALATHALLHALRVLYSPISSGHLSLFPSHLLHVLLLSYLTVFNLSSNTIWLVQFYFIQTTALVADTLLTRSHIQNSLILSRIITE